MKIEKIEYQSESPIPSGLQRVAAIAVKTLKSKKYSSLITKLPRAVARTRSLYSNTHLVILAKDADDYGIPSVTKGWLTV